jgi:hypothetical protein
VDDPKSITTPKAKIENTTNVGKVSNMLNSQFKDYEFLINGQPVRNQNGTFSYFAFLKALITFSDATKNGALRAAGWNLDSVDVECTDVKEQANPGFYHRSKYYWARRKVTLFGPLLTDLYDCGGLLFSNSEYTIRLFRQPHVFCLMSHKRNANFIVNISKAELYVTRLKLSTAIPRSIRFIQSDCRLLSVPVAVRNVDAEIYQGELPRRVIIIQALAETFSGSYTKNPFNLQHFGATNISVLVNGNAHPVENNMLVMDPTSSLESICQVAHHQLYGLGLQDATIHVHAENFKTGTFFWPVNLDADEKVGVLRLQIDYKDPISAAVTVLVFGDFDRRLEKDNIGKITVT